MLNLDIRPQGKMILPYMDTNNDIETLHHKEREQILTGSHALLTILRLNIFV